MGRDAALNEKSIKGGKAREGKNKEKEY